MPERRRREGAPRRSRFALTEQSGQMVDNVPDLHYYGAMTFNDFIADDDLIDFRSAQMDAGQFEDFPIYYEVPEWDYEDREDEADEDAPVADLAPGVTYMPAGLLLPATYDDDDIPF